MDLTKKLERNLGVAYRRACDAGANNDRELREFEKRINQAQRKGLPVEVYRRCLQKLKEKGTNEEKNTPSNGGWD